MRPAKTLLGTLAVLASAVPAFCQFQIAGACGGDISATVSVTPSPMRTATVTGHPWSGWQSTEGVRILPDGTRQNQNRRNRQEEWTWRDSSGRTRIERKGNCGSFVIMIADPVSGYAYAIDTVNQLAHRAPLLPPRVRRNQQPATGESLGTQTMSGVTVEGSRTISVRPSGGPGNTPLTTTMETWTAPQLGVVVYQKQSDSDGSEYITKINDLSTKEPSAAFFHVPAGYRIVDESGPFTVIFVRPYRSDAGARTPSTPSASTVTATKTAQPSQSPVPLRSFRRFLELPNSGDDSAAVSVGDVNRDGFLDIVLSTGRHLESPVRLYLGNGKGEFSSADVIGRNQGYASYGAPLADLNGDGLLDLALGTDSGDDKPVFFGDGKGHFMLAGTFGDAAMPARNIAVADLNGDGAPDIVIANRGAQSYVYLNDGKGGFAQKRPFGGAGDSTVTAVVADVNQDGKPDVVVAHRDRQQSVVFLNDGHANFGDPRPFGPSDADTRAVAAGDLNGDGYPDIVACHLGLGTFVYLNDGHGNFGKGIQITDKPDDFYSLAIADMNRDGKPDIIGGNAGHPDAVFFNEKDGTTFQRVEVGDDDEDATTYGLAIADLENDGYPDIVVARTDGPSGIFFSTEFSPRAPATVAPAKETALSSIPSASFLVAIRPSTGVITIEQPSPGIRDWASVTPEELFASAYHTDPALVRVNAIASGKYDATVNLGKAAQKDADRLFQEALCAFFHVTAAQEASETPVLVLRTPAGKNAKIEPSETGADRTMRLDKFVRELEEWLKQPVIDETGLAGDYEVLFNWEGVTRETLAAELLQQLDISAAVERRSVVFTVLEQAN